jgi:uncharacterized repeat protein (TIGR01451 family)
MRLVSVVLLLVISGLRVGGGVRVAARASDDLLDLVLQADPAFDPVRPSLVGHGDFITYTLVAMNIGSEVQTQVVLSNSVPLGTSLVASSLRPEPSRLPSASLGALVWEVVALNPGEMFTASYTVRVSNYVTVTAIINKATADSIETSWVQSNTTVHPFDFTKNPPVQYLYYLFMLSIP